ncbi:Ribonuclease III [Chloroherpeton thalassium ATCC 35110]|uniref:Ribonuclease 3 n=1 Tax=Chloroherpeton thalassium (strain ATCC 35110 / GB-78) TaxID=517418 RepID=B3QS76_CHLT3|nr:ribonuclease III [Chloroherpeton thalassium]ACF14021.1 Ribonuclease III [Chloroherpeton thalassium ATCC 35110]
MERLSDILRKYYQRIFKPVDSDQHEHHEPRAGEMLSEDTKLEIESLTGFPISNVIHYETALTHRSAIDLNVYSKKKFVSNERLEFLGDAVLDLVVAECLYTRFPDYDEGKLTKLRSQLVNARTLASFARKIHLGSLLIVSEAAEAIGVRDSETTLADAFEALVGAIYLDSDYLQTKRFLEKKILEGIDFRELSSTDNNFKSVLLEYAQAHHLEIPTYTVIDEEGPSHKKVFTVAVYIGDEMLGKGVGRSKKAAEQLAAQQAVAKLRMSK